MVAPNSVSNGGIEFFCAYPFALDTVRVSCGRHSVALAANSAVLQ